MQQMYERLSNGERSNSNPASDKRVLAQQPETSTWNDDPDSYMDYMAYAQTRNDGKSHSQAAEYVEKQRSRR